jgi:hypothetical protein
MESLTFLGFMTEGGWGMWPVLLFGLVCLGAGVRFATRPGPRWLAFAGALWLTVLTAMLHAILTNLSAVFRSVAAADSERTTFLFVGLKESLRPGALGGIFLTLAALAVAIGAFRSRWGEGA